MWECVAFFAYRRIEGEDVTLTSDFLAKCRMSEGHSI